MAHVPAHVRWYRFCERASAARHIGGRRVPTMKVREVLRLHATDGWAPGTPSYPFAIVPTATGFSAGALQFTAVATAPTRALLLDRLADIVALHVADALVAGTPLDPPLDPTALDLSDYTAEGLHPDVVYVAPAPISDASVAIARALRGAGLPAAELARRLGVARSAISRWTDPLYFGHTTRSLRQVAAALGLRLVVAFERTTDA